MEQLVLVVVVLCAVLTAVGGFLIGDRRRRGQLGQAGPRPVRSIGEAVRLASQRRQRVLVLFLDDGEASTEVGRALAEEPAVLAVLRGVPHVVVRCSDADRDVAETLYAKYAGEPPAKLPAALQLDPDGQFVAAADLGPRGPLEGWLAGWLDPRETPGPAPLR